LQGKKLRLYVTREKLSWFLNKTTFIGDDILNKPTAIVFIAKDENTILNTIPVMFIEELYTILLEKHNNRKFNFVLDNFDSIAKCNELVDILSSCLSRNVKVYLGTRSFDELIVKYGSYIVNLCDLVSIMNDEVKLVINKEEEKISKDFNKVVIRSNQNIQYPRLNKQEVKLFDLEKEVKSLRQKDPIAIEEDLKEKMRLDELMKSIDQKIEKIELEEKESGEK